MILFNEFGEKRWGWVENKWGEWDEWSEWMNEWMMMKNKRKKKGDAKSAKKQTVTSILYSVSFKIIFWL